MNCAQHMRDIFIGTLGSDKGVPYITFCSMIELLYFFEYRSLADVINRKTVVRDGRAYCEKYTIIGEWHNYFC